MLYFVYIVAIKLISDIILCHDKNLKSIPSDLHIALKKCAIFYFVYYVIINATLILFLRSVMRAKREGGAKRDRNIFTSFILVRQSSTAIGDARHTTHHLFHTSKVLLLLETILNKKN